MKFDKLRLTAVSSRLKKKRPRSVSAGSARKPRRYKLKRKLERKPQSVKQRSQVRARKRKGFLRMSLRKRRQVGRGLRARRRSGVSKLVVPATGHPVVSIIIPVYNKWNHTYACLASIVKHTKNIPYEIIVVDDLSNDLTKRIGHFVESVTVIRNKVKSGFLHNCNTAASRARGKYVLLLNNDTEMKPDWLDHMLRLAEADPSIGIVGPKMIYPDGRLQEAGAIIFNSGNAINYGRLDNPDKHAYNYVKEVDYISGAAILVRKDLWNAVGGFDTRYAPAYSEDADLAFAARSLGYKVVYQPKSVIVHYEGISHGTDLQSGIKRYQVINQQKFAEKWADVLKRENEPDGGPIFYARDRSRGKKTVLVIDYGIPAYDRDAGSLTTSLYLKLLVSMGCNVKFLPDNLSKLEPYGSELESLGIEVLYGTSDRSYYERWIMDHGQYLDYVLLNRPEISHKYIPLIKNHTRAKIIYYGHDLHFVRELKRYGLEKNRDALHSAENYRNLEFDLFKNSDTILTCSESEKRVIDLHFPNQSATWMPAFYFDDPPQRQKSWNERSGFLFIGGFNHGPNADGILWFCREVLPLVASELPEAKLYIVGSNPTPEILKLKSNRVVVKGYVTNAELMELYHTVKLAIIPLRYGAGVKGKTVEALRLQTPIVSTPTGIEGLPNLNGIIEGKTSPQSFAEEMIRLYRNHQLLEHKAQQYRQYVLDYFSRGRAEQSMQLALQPK